MIPCDCAAPLYAALIGQMCTLRVFFSCCFLKQQAVSSIVVCQLLSHVVIPGSFPAVAPIPCPEFNKAGQFQRGNTACSAWRTAVAWQTWWLRHC